MKDNWKEIMLKKQKLRKESINLKKGAFDIGNYEKSVKMREKEKEVYKKFKFYDEIMKAINNNNNK